MTKNSSSEPPDGPGAGSRGAEGELGPGHHLTLPEYTCREWLKIPPQNHLMALELAAEVLRESWDLVITSPFLNEAGVLLGKESLKRLWVYL
jgi:hypothetical protein